jgi:hypothetical protein
MLIICDHETDWDHTPDVTPDGGIPEAAAFYYRDILKGHVPDLFRVILDDGSHFAVDLTKPPEERVTKLDSPTLLACVHQTLEACDGICLDNEDEREIVNQKLTAAIFGDKPSTSAGLMRKHLRGGEAYVEQVRRMSMSATHRRWGMDLKRTHGELLKHQNWHGYLLEDNVRLKAGLEHEMSINDELGVKLLKAESRSVLGLLWFKIKRLFTATP